LELLLLEVLLGRRMLGDLPRPTPPDLMSGGRPRPTGPDLRSLQPLMAGRAMATAQGLTRTPWSSILPLEDGAEPNRTVINFAGRHSCDRDEATGTFSVVVFLFSPALHAGLISWTRPVSLIAICREIGLRTLN
jgi:hypothetical protein